MSISKLTSAAFCAALASAQSIQPLRTPPVEKLTIDLGFRDWAPTTIAGTTILAGNPTGAGGLFAVDLLSGKLKWKLQPAFNGGTASVSTPPVVAGEIVIVPFASAYPGALVGVSLATGKELWRGPDPAIKAGAAVASGLVFVMAKNGVFHALDTANGRERWKLPLSNRAECASRPIVRDDTIYLTGNATAGNFLFALDAKTGQELWRYRAEAPYVHAGVCLHQPVVTADTIFASGENWLYAVDRATGRDRWKIEVRRPVEGRERGVEVHGLVDADSVLIGMTEGFLIAFDKSSGRTVWELPGKYRVASPSTAVVGNVLYFQGPSGTLQALDLNTRSILWSFTRPTREKNWSFGYVTPVDGGLWVDSYQALVKLQ